MQTLQSHKSYIDSINQISVSKKRTRQSNDQLDEKERKNFRRAVAHFNGSQKSADQEFCFIHLPLVQV